MLSSSLPVSFLPSPAVLPSPFARASMATSVELPRLSIPREVVCQQQETGHSYDNTCRRVYAVGYHSAPPFPVKIEASCTAMQSLHGLATRSPSSPSSFFPQPEITKFALTPLLEAAEQVRPLTVQTSPPLDGRSNPLKRDLSLTHTLPSTTHAMGGYPLDKPKKARISSGVDLDVQALSSLFGHLPRRTTIYQISVPQQQPQQLLHHQSNEQHTASCVPVAEVQIPSIAGSKSPNTRGLPANLGTSVWKIVLSTGKFPSDICLCETGSGDRASRIAPFNLREIQSSSEKFAAKCLPSKTMRVSKKVPSIHLSPRGLIGRTHDPVTPREESFNPLSLKSIMNNEPTASPSSDVHDAAESIANSNLIRQSPSGRSVEETKKPLQRVLKRSDYSQHGMVRSGRWSMEEENYAKAMIEAFKAGYLPLDGNVSLRKFLSEVLVCHPMRISKKFVGYVRKYHWYRIAAGKCDPEAKRQVLYRLSHLERVFWTSLQQNSECPSGLRRDG